MADDLERTQSGRLVNNLIRTAAGLRDTYYCHICCEIQPVGEESMKLANCGHHVHRSCWQQYLKFDIMNNAGRRAPVCFKPNPPAEKGGEETICGTVIADSDMRVLLDDETYETFERLAASHNQPAMRSCSKCDHSQDSSIRSQTSPRH